MSRSDIQPRIGVLSLESTTGSSSSVVVSSLFVTPASTPITPKTLKHRHKVTHQHACPVSAVTPSTLGDCTGTNPIDFTSAHVNKTIFERFTE